MYSFYRKIDEYALACVQEYEEFQLSKFKNEFDDVCLEISNLHGWNYTACVYRWIDKAYRLGNHPFDGYTATLQVDFTDGAGNVIEIDEYVCSFFENITHIAFHPSSRKYKVFQNEHLDLIRTDIQKFARRF